MNIIQEWLVKLAAKKAAKKLNLQEGPMDKKKWYLSKSIWTGVVTAIIGTYEVVKLNVVPSLPPIPPIVFTILGIFGVYARTVADKKIG